MTLEKPNTRKSYISFARRWEPIVGDLYLHEITREHIVRYIAQRREEAAARGKILSDATLRPALAYLSGVFAFSHYEPNPVVQFNKKFLKPVRKVVRFMTPEEEVRILDACTEDMHALMIVFAVETGLRAMEQAGLTWDMIDLKAREIGLVDPSKLKTGRARIVPLSTRAMQVLSLIPRRPDVPYLFYTPAGRPYQSTFSLWHRIREKAGLFDLRWHDLRHTFATRFLRGGGSLPVLSRILGHSNIMMTMRYAHLVTEDLHAEMQKVDTALTAPSPTRSSTHPR
ncbi:site-specific integrase [Niveispirillum sp. BGYR6]|uniref:tyrosine-type recombinase/integrase n=1 Tax=Niveispirillum sp. BGYR6 TaxID=2971249 RepID=UPI0022B97D31|nr:site-specific integrase [Niveispirillum sp. BGYR6]MDG5496990.1 site-specific integrase [Niveispirillum sp. BGYR6]